MSERKETTTLSKEARKHHINKEKKEKNVPRLILQ
jgi:hypothetical protein